MSGNFEIPQAPFKPSVVIKQQNPNLTSLEMSAPEIGTIMKQKFNGNNGYMEQMGQNVPFSEDQINSSKSKNWYDIVERQNNHLSKMLNQMNPVRVKRWQWKSALESDIDPCVDVGPGRPSGRARRAAPPRRSRASRPREP